MNNPVKASAILLGSLGRAVLAHMNQAEKPAIDLYLGNTLIQQDPWPDKPSAAKELGEEVVFVVAQLEDLSQAALQKIRQETASQRFIIVLTGASSVEYTADGQKQKEVLALVDSLIIAPVAEGVLVETLYKALTCLANLTLESQLDDVSVDFEDVKTILRNAGPAAIGLGVASGENRGALAAERSFSYPFMHSTQIANAQRALLRISSGGNAALEMEEFILITDLIQEKCGNDCEVIFGHRTHEALDQEIEVLLLVTQPA